MDKKVLIDIGPLELKVLGVLNSEGDLSVAEVQQSLLTSGHKLAYTTVMTVLVRLFNKNLVLRRKVGRQYIYSAAQKKGRSPLIIFERIKRSLFGSEKLKPILGLLDAEDGLSREELEELKAVIEERLERN